MHENVYRNVWECIEMFEHAQEGMKVQICMYMFENQLRIYIHVRKCTYMYENAKKIEMYKNVQ